MKVSYDPAKRAKTLQERGLDFDTAGSVFAGLQMTLEDTRQDYDERRFQTYGLLGERMVVVVWTEAADGRRIISMRKCNEREQARYRQQLG